VKTENFGPDEYFEYAKGLFDKGKYFKAQTELTVIVLKYSGDPVVDDAQYYLAESHFKQKEFIIAVSEYQKLINDYPESPYVSLSQFKKAMSYQNMSSRAELDQVYTKKAIKEFQNFIEEYPKHELKENAEKYINDLREKLALKIIMSATTYRKMGIYDSAIIYYDIILEDYYDTAQAEKALFWKGMCYYGLKKYIEARVAFSTFIEKYPKHRYSRKAKKTVEKITDKLSELEEKEKLSSDSE
jgi:outer membrane protein assembly factor BamD